MMCLKKCSVSIYSFPVPHQNVAVMGWGMVGDVCFFICNCFGLTQIKQHRAELHRQSALGALLSSSNTSPVQS